MSADDFFSRWSRRKQASNDQRNQDAIPVAADADAAPAAPAEALPPPTLDDVAALTHQSDFRRFVAPGVDEGVRRSAMKKLFTDPHFNVMDGLDIYIDDYNKFEPLSAATVALLAHAKPLLDPLGHLQQPAMRMLDLGDNEAEASGSGKAGPNDTTQQLAQPASEPVQPENGNPSEPGASPAEPPETAGMAAPSAEAGDPIPPDSVAPNDDHTI